MAAGGLVSATTTNRYNHMARIRDGKGMPTRKEIIQQKQKLDKAFKDWIDHA